MSVQDWSSVLLNIIRIHHDGEGGIEKSIPGIIDWHHKACRVITNSDHEGWIFLSHLYTYNGLFFLHTIKYDILNFKIGSQKLLNMLGCNIKHNEATLTC